MSKKLIFLDIDGVLNNTASLSVGVHLMNEKCIMLNRLLEQTGAKVVISSTWRILYDYDTLESMLLRSGCPYAYGLAGITPTSDTGHRGSEIARWMEVIDWNPLADQYIIIDDDSDFHDYQKPFHIHTNHHAGFTWRDYDKALELLNHY